MTWPNEWDLLNSTLVQYVLDSPKDIFRHDIPSKSKRDCSCEPT